MDETIRKREAQESEVFLKKILSVFLLLVWGVIFGSVCTAAPLMVEKNLFSSDRKPPPPDSVDASGKPAKPGMAIGNIQLDGIIIQNNVKKAILRMKSLPAGPPTKKGQPASPFITVREGQTVSDYRVSKIESKSISLEKDGQSFTIGLFAENKVIAPPSPIPAPAPAPAPGPVAGQPPGAKQPGTNQAPGVRAMPGQPAPMAPEAPGDGANRNVQQNDPPPDPNQAAVTVDQQQ